MKSSKQAPTVYSTSVGKICPDCGQAKAGCRCAQKRSASVGDGIVRVGRQTKGRKGKGVTMVTGVPLGGAELNALGRELKQRCGSGGTVKDGIIEIQGDHRELLVELLQAKGWQVKKAGG